MNSYQVGWRVVSAEHPGHVFKIADITLTAVAYGKRVYHLLLDRELSPDTCTTKETWGISDEDIMPLMMERNGLYYAWSGENVCSGLACTALPARWRQCAVDGDGSMWMAAPQYASKNEYMPEYQQHQLNCDGMTPPKNAMELADRLARGDKDPRICRTPKTTPCCPDCGSNTQMLHFLNKNWWYCPKCGQGYTDMEVVADPDRFKRAVHQPNCRCSLGDISTATGAELDAHAYGRIGRWDPQTSSEYQDVETDEELAQRLMAASPTQALTLPEIKKFVRGMVDADILQEVFVANDEPEIVRVHIHTIQTQKDAAELSERVRLELEKIMPCGVSGCVTINYTPPDKEPDKEQHSFGWASDIDAFTELVSKTNEIFIIREAYLDYAGLQKPTTADGRLALIKTAHAFVCGTAPGTRIELLPWKLEWEDDLWLINTDGTMIKMTNKADVPDILMLPPQKVAPPSKSLVMKNMGEHRTECNADGTKTVYKKPEVPYAYVRRQDYTPWDPEDNDDLLG